MKDNSKFSTVRSYCILRLKIIILLSFMFILVAATPTTEPTHSQFSDFETPRTVTFSTSYTNHTAITISMDTDFSSQGFPGYGNETHPYVIEGYYIESAGSCITIAGTTAHYVIRNCYLTSELGSGDPSIRIDSAPNGTIQDTYTDGHSYGAAIYGSTNFTIINVTVEGASSFGIWQRLSDSLTINNSKILNSNYGIYSWINSYSTFFNNSVTNCELGGIYAQDSTCLILNNTIDNVESNGIPMYGSPNSNIAFNTITNCGDSGIYLSDCAGSTLRFNSLESNHDGIYFKNTDECYIYNNSLSNNGILMEGSSLNYYIHSFDNNTVNGKELGYFESLNDTSIDGSSYGLIFVVNCSFFEITDGIFDNSTQGVTILSSDNYTLTGLSSLNQIDNGFHFENCQDFMITDCIAANSDNGINLDASSFCDIWNSTVYENQNGMYIWDSTNCTVYNCTAYLNTEMGIYFVGQNGTILENTAYSNGDSGFKISYKDHEICGNIAYNNTANGFRIIELINSSMTQNIANSSAVGFYLENLMNTNYSQNVAYDNSDSGIIIYSSDASTLSNNSIINNSHGINFDDSTELIILNNTFVNNGIYANGFAADYFYHTIENNTINGKKLGYFVGLTDSIIDGNEYGQVILVECTNTNVTNLVAENATIGADIHFSISCTISNSVSNYNSRYGFRFHRSDKCTVEDSVAEYNKYHGVFAFLSGESIFDNLTCRYNEMYGLYLFGSEESILVKNNASINDQYGIYLRNSPYSSVLENDILSNTDYGIYIYDSGNTDIISNFGQWNSEGLFLELSDGVSVLGNEFLSNQIGIRNSQSHSCSFENNVLEENDQWGINIDSADLIELYNNTFSDNGDYGLYVYGSNDGIVENNTAIRSITGFYLQNCINWTIINNTAIDNLDGFKLRILNDSIAWNNTAESNSNYAFNIMESFNISLQHSTITNQGYTGILLMDTDNSTIFNNLILENAIGIHVDADSYYNLLYYNKIGFNSQFNALDQGTGNMWHNTSHGNYWSDLGSSSTYLIDGNAESVDLYPYHLEYAPILSHPDDIDYELGSTGYSIVWEVTDTDIDSYEIYQDGSLVDSGQVNGDSLSIDVNGLTSGNYNFTLYVNDTSGKSSIDTVYVNVHDSTSPDINHPGDIGYELGAIGNEFAWTATDLDLASYTVYQDGSVIDSGPYSGQTLTIDVDGLSVGEYNFTVKISDGSGNSITDTVIITVVDTTSPSVDSPSDITYDEGETGSNITWQVDELDPARYIIFRNGSGIVIDDWNGEDIMIDVDILSPGTYNYTLYLIDESDNEITDTVWVTVVDIDPPYVSSPEDKEIVYGTGGNQIIWFVSDTNLDTYTVYRNVSLIATGPVVGDNVTAYADMLNEGFYNFTVTVYDTLGASTSDSVIVHVVDTSPPSISTPGDIHIDVGEEDRNITWILISDYTYYRVYRNATPIVYNTTGDVAVVSLNGLSIGLYNFTIEIHNQYDVTTDTVFLTVKDDTLPTIDSPDDITYTEGEIGHTIVWEAFDFAPDFYEIHMNASLLLNGSWDGSAISLNVDHLRPGGYIFDLDVYDTEGHSETDSVVVTVLPVEEPGPTSSTTTSTTTATLPTATQDNAPLFLGIGLGAGIMIGVVLIVLVVPFVRKKIS